MKDESRKTKELLKGYRDLFIRCVIFLLLLYLFFSKILFLERVNGMDMFPSLKDGDLALGYRLEQEYRTNDVVAYEENGKTCFGRVIALGGDEVDIDGSGEVKINGASESGEILYPSENGGKLKYPYKVPKNSFFILGDYRTEAKDSRNYGAVSIKQIKGKVLTILRRRGL